MTVMRMKGKNHEVEPGKWAQWPQTREEAMLQRTVYYSPFDGSKNCQHTNLPSVYTLTGINRCCAMQESSDACHHAITVLGEPHDPNEAYARGFDYWWRYECGKYCGHVGKTTLDGRCYVCMHEKKQKEPSPRLVAMDKGEKWYMPKEGDLCRNGHHALRRVDNGICSECVAVAKATARAESPEPEPEIPIYRSHPDMVISHADAKALGFKHYRTGEPCAHGHRAWRYISTRNCLTCMGRG